MVGEEHFHHEDYNIVKHSGLGIASFVISIVMVLYDFSLVAIAGVLEATTPGGVDEESATAVILGLFLFLGFVINLAGIGLGIAGLTQKNRKRIFSVLGLIINLAILIVVIGLMVIGLTLS